MLYTRLLCAAAAADVVRVCVLAEKQCRFVFDSLNPIITFTPPPPSAQQDNENNELNGNEQQADEGIDYYNSIIIIANNVIICTPRSVAPEL